jgi:hypothetical protein
MRLVESNVSTAGRFRTMALRLAIRRTPKASATVTTIGRPSGIAATASAADTKNSSSRSNPRRSPMKK